LLAIKVAAPEVATCVIDRAIQARDAAGVSQDHLLAELYAVARILRIADGPDEVHHMAIARRETQRYRQIAGPARVGFTQVYGAPGVSACTVLSR
jgi:alkylation response protein AidB-like acyl-CoA dehydrogenase